MTVDETLFAVIGLKKSVVTLSYDFSKMLVIKRNLSTVKEVEKTLDWFGLNRDSRGFISDTLDDYNYNRGETFENSEFDCIEYNVHDSDKLQRVIVTIASDVADKYSDAPCSAIVDETNFTILGKQIMFCAKHTGQIYNFLPIEKYKILNGIAGTVFNIVDKVMCGGEEKLLGIGYSGDSYLTANDFVIRKFKPDMVSMGNEHFLELEDHSDWLFLSWAVFDDAGRPLVGYPDAIAVPPCIMDKIREHYKKNHDALWVGRALLCASGMFFDGEGLHRVKDIGEEFPELSRWFWKEGIGKIYVGSKGNIIPWHPIEGTVMKRMEEFFANSP